MSQKPDYRYPGELRTLVLTLITAAVLVTLFAPLTAGGVLLVVVVGLGLNWAAAAASVARVKRTAVPVERSPELARVVEECRLNLDFQDELNVYVVQSDRVNAYATGFLPPYTIVLYSGLVEAMDRDELAFVIGHEMGHCRFRHTSLLALIGQLGQQTFGLRGLGVVIRLVFLAWMRVGEYTADRAGLLACGGKLDKAVSTQLKLVVGPARRRAFDVPTIVAHWREHDVAATAQLADALSTHPGMEARLDKLVDFAHSTHFAQLARGLR
jgi:Zn-dependent protease with chaperone function